MLIAGLDIGGRHGGAERFGLELACSLERQHLAQVTLVAFWQMNTPIENAWQAAIEEQGVKVIFCALWRRSHDITGYLQGVRALEKQLLKPIYILHSHFQLGSLAAIWLKQRKKAEFICRTAHITREWGDDSLAVVLRSSINSWVYPRYLDAEVGVSQAVSEMLNSRPGNRKNNLFIPNAIPNVFPASQQPISTNSSAEKTIGFIGRTTGQKDLATLIKAFSLVKISIPELKLDIVGDGPQKTLLKDLCTELGLTSSVRFLGTITDSQQLLRNWQMLVLPSIYEGLPTVVLEALANGIPVIGSDIPGIRDLIEPGINGWLFPAGDTRVLVDLIRQAVSDPIHILSMSTACRESVQGYDVDVIASQYSQMCYPH
jgi:glycosyltransferase involved in cell wall biosynthesis